MKKIGITLLIFIAIITGALFWLHSNLDGLVRDAIVRYGSEMTQAEVSVGNVKIDAINGEGIISDFVVGNPKGFKTPYAFKVKAFTVAIDPTSITGSVVTVKKIGIISPEVIYEKNDTTTNFDAIQKNITSYLGLVDSKPSEGKKLIVKELKINDAKAQATAAFMNGKTINVDLPDLSMHNIGKAEGGVTAGELGQKISSAMTKQLSKAVSFDALSKAAQRSGEVIEKAIGDASDKIKSLF